MKLDGMKCPNCGSENTHVWQNEETNIWDDSTYKFFWKSLEKINFFLGVRKMLFISASVVTARCTFQQWLFWMSK